MLKSHFIQMHKYLTKPQRKYFVMIQKYYQLKNSLYLICACIVPETNSIHAIALDAHISRLERKIHLTPSNRRLYASSLHGEEN